MRAIACVAVAVLYACRSQPAAVATTDASPIVVRDAGTDPLTDLRSAAERSNGPAGWRAYGDALSKAKSFEEAIRAYDRCAFAAGEELEASLYCQMAGAVAKKMQAKRTTGDAGP